MKKIKKSYEEGTAYWEAHGAKLILEYEKLKKEYELEKATLACELKNARDMIKYIEAKHSLKNDKEISNFKSSL